MYCWKIHQWYLIWGFGVHSTRLCVHCSAQYFHCIYAFSKFWVIGNRTFPAVCLKQLTGYTITPAAFHFVSTELQWTYKQGTGVVSSLSNALTRCGVCSCQRGGEQQKHTALTRPLFWFENGPNQMKPSFFPAFHIDSNKSQQLNTFMSIFSIIIH